MIENDKPGTVRLSPDGTVAIRTGPEGTGRYVWALSVARKGSFWVTDEHVRTWPTIYVPPVPVGTLMYRKFEHNDPFSDDDDSLFEAAVMTHKGWIWVNQGGAYSNVEPKNDGHGEWTTVPVLD